MTTHFVFDQKAESQSVQAEWSIELNERLPEIVKLWESIGPALVEAVAATTKKPFSAPETVHLTLTDQPSNSFFGVTVNMRYALRSFTAKPVPMRYKIDTVFHEALHGFVSRNTPKMSPLLAQHSSQPICVRNHLHLLALQKASLLHTKDPAALEQVVALDSQLPSGCYKRAWSLLNATPSTYLQYIEELSQ
ncbi:hypothetical protein [Rhodoferax aquaticus]|uniref:Uncharacterized protein n=1 Tax=Rhodoferax aquaticus TaxID=2527691 RepID=A0A515EJW2_9BURK|nr:hypothetical protein [Rhodoferax aquaticus]QDL52947.1 hypothetical protein EXZ61_01475 [Rhodoferax aquaticus]